VRDHRDGLFSLMPGYLKPWAAGALFRRRGYRSAAGAEITHGRGWLRILARMPVAGENANASSEQQKQLALPAQSAMHHRQRAGIGERAQQKRRGGVLTCEWYQAQRGRGHQQRQRAAADPAEFDQACRLALIVGQSSATAKAAARVVGNPAAR
jgi:hypothetical protein